MVKRKRKKELQRELQVNSKRVLDYQTATGGLTPHGDRPVRISVADRCQRGRRRIGHGRPPARQVGARPHAGPRAGRQADA
jgi:hypothetical protein